MTLGNLIKNYRKEHSLSQQAFADMAGLSKACSTWRGTRQERRLT